MISRRDLLRCALASAVGAVGARAQDRSRPPAPPEPPLSTIPWWLWPGMFVPPLFLIVSGYIATRRFDRHRGGPPASPPPAASGGPAA